MSARSFLGGLAVGLAVVTAPALTGAQTGESPADQLARPVETEEQAVALAEDLARLGPQVLPELFAALASGVFGIEDSEPHELDPLRARIVLEAITRLSPTAVHVYMAGLDRSALAAGERRAALLIYGVIGGAEDLRSMVALAAPMDPRALIDPELRRTFRDACVEVLGRDERAAGSVRGAFDVAHPSLQAELVGAVHRARPAQALALFGSLLGVSVELDLLVLSAIGDVARHSSQTIEAEVGAAVLHCLVSGDERRAQAAAAALAELEDPRAVPDLIALLEASNANLAASADRALVRIAGRDFRGDRARWQAWYDDEQTWWNRAEAQLLASLRSDRDVDVARALNEVAGHRLFRRELEYSLLAELGDDDPSIVAMACTTLGRLGSRAAAAEIEALCAHADPRVAEAARLARRRIPGPPASQATAQASDE